MDQTQIPITKSNLQRLREELALAREGLELLDEKKEILVNQLSFLTSKAKQVRSRVNLALERAYDHLQKGLREVGEAAVESAGLGLKAGEQVTIKERSLMGVVLPMVRLDLPDFRPGYSLYGTSSDLDQTSMAIHEAIESIAELAEVEVGIERLMAELKRTLKRINALRFIYLPYYETTVKRVEARLEEKEREGFFQLKLVRRRADATNKRG